MKHVALITGAAQGVGYAIGKRLFESGYKVVISDINLDAAQSAAQTIEPTGEHVIAMRLDVQKKPILKLHWRKHCLPLIVAMCWSITPQ